MANKRINKVIKAILFVVSVLALAALLSFMSSCQVTKTTQQKKALRERPHKAFDY